MGMCSIFIVLKVYWEEMKGMLDCGTVLMELRDCHSCMIDG
jgi:hypothetical protein